MNDPPGVPVPDPIACALSDLTLLRRGCGADMEALARENLSRQQRRVHDVLRDIAALHPNVHTYSPEDYLCNDRRCLLFLNGEFLYRDRFHIRRNLSTETVSRLVELMHLPDLLRPAAAAPGPAQRMRLSTEYQRHD